jgi:hypothetical protein
MSCCAIRFEHDTFFLFYLGRTASGRLANGRELAIERRPPSTCCIVGASRQSGFEIVHASASVGSSHLVKSLPASLAGLRIKHPTNIHLVSGGQTLAASARQFVCSALDDCHPGRVDTSSPSIHDSAG